MKNARDEYLRLERGPLVSCIEVRIGSSVLLIRLSAQDIRDSRK
jgi:hypothetical protein